MKKQYEMLQWDSEFFGYKVASLGENNFISEELEGILAELQKKQVRLVYWFVQENNSIGKKVADVNNGLLVDKKVTYVRRFTGQEEFHKDPNIISYFGKTLNEHLRSLSIQSGEYSRYKIDPHFKDDDYKKMYEIWIRKSLSGAMADEVFVYVDKGKEQGVIVLSKKDDSCTVILMAVDEKSRGKSIGSKLMEAAFKYALGRGIQTIKVITQKDNKAACTFYEKNGFQDETVQYVYHFWLNNTL